MNIQLLIEDEQVDLTENIQFPMNLVFTDFENPSAIKTEWSKTITIPYTENNNKIFGNIFKLEKIISKDSSDSNIGYNYNPNIGADYILLYNSEIINEGTVKFNSLSDEGYEINLFSELYKYLTYLKNIKMGEFYFGLDENQETIWKYLTSSEIKEVIENNKLIKEHIMWYDFEFKSKNINAGIVDVKGSDVYSDYNPKNLIRFITPWSGDIKNFDTSNIIWQEENTPSKLNTKIYNNDYVLMGGMHDVMLSINNLIPSLKFETILSMVGKHTGLDITNLLIKDNPEYIQYGGLCISKNLHDSPYFNKLLLTMPLYDKNKVNATQLGFNRNSFDWLVKYGDYIEKFNNIKINGSVLLVNKSEFDNSYIPKDVEQIIVTSASSSNIEVEYKMYSSGDTFMLYFYNTGGVINGNGEQSPVFFAPYEYMKENFKVELWSFKGNNQPKKVAEESIFTEELSKYDYIKEDKRYKGAIDISLIPEEDKYFDTKGERIRLKLIDNNASDKVVFENQPAGNYFIKLNLNIPYKEVSDITDWVQTDTPYDDENNAAAVYNDMCSILPDLGDEHSRDNVIKELRKGMAYWKNSQKQPYIKTSMQEPELFANPDVSSLDSPGINIKVFTNPNLNSFTQGLGDTSLFDILVNYCKLFNLKIEFKDNKIWISSLNTLFKDANDTKKYIDITDKIDFSSKKITYNNKYKYLNFNFAENTSTLDKTYKDNTGVTWGSKKITRQSGGNESLDIIKSLFNTPIISNKSIRFFNGGIDEEKGILEFQNNIPTSINLPDYTEIDGDSLKFNYKPLGIILENDKEILNSENVSNGRYVLEDNLPVEDEKQKYSYKIVSGNGIDMSDKYNITHPLGVNSYTKIGSGYNAKSYSCLFSTPSVSYSIGKDSEPKNIYDRCWTKTIDELYDINTRLMEVDVNFSLADYKNFKWSNIYIINNTLWRINKIIDYNIGTKGLTKIQFISIQDVNNLIKNQDL